MSNLNADLGWLVPGSWNLNTSTAFAQARAAPPPTFTTFRFTSFNSNIFNCIVVGPQAQPYLRVKTVLAPAPGYTVFQNTAGENVALVEWQKHPLAEIQNVTYKQPVSRWLELAPDLSYRTMNFKGRQFIWAPCDRVYICLYIVNGSQVQLIGRIVRGHDKVSLDLTPEAIQMGLLEVAVVATFLLQCGRNID